jgi:hypothetical protein
MSGVIATISIAISIATISGGISMPRLTFRHWCLVLLLALSVTVVPHAYAAQARLSTVPEEKGVVAVPGVSIPAATNGLLNSDMAIYVTDSSTFTSLAAEGHLLLAPKGSPGTYAGTFVDDLGGAKIFSAKGTNISATTLTGSYEVNSQNGKFTFVIGNSFTSTVPSKYGNTASIGTILFGSHAYTPQTPLAVTIATFTIGGFIPPVTSGTLTLTTDVIGYIVPFNNKLGVNSNLSYVQNGHLGQNPITSYGQYFPPDGNGDGSLTCILKVGSNTLTIDRALEDSGGQKIISGDALSVSGNHTTSASFSAK